MTYQIPDTVNYKGETYKTYSDPFVQYRYKFDRKQRPQFEMTSTANWHGYLADYEIKEDKLFMINFEGNLCLEIDKCYKDVGLDYFFPNQKEQFADWFTGGLHLWTDEQQRSRAELRGSYNEDELYLEFKDGILVNSFKIPAKVISIITNLETKLHFYEHPPQRWTVFYGIGHRFFPPTV